MGINQLGGIPAAGLYRLHWLEILLEAVDQVVKQWRHRQVKEDMDIWTSQPQFWQRQPKEMLRCHCGSRVYVSSEYHCCCMQMVKTIIIIHTVHLCFDVCR